MEHSKAFPPEKSPSNPGEDGIHRPLEAVPPQYRAGWSRTNVGKGKDMSNAGKSSRSLRLIYDLDRQDSHCVWLFFRGWPHWVHAVLKTA